MLLSASLNGNNDTTANNHPDNYVVAVKATYGDLNMFSDAQVATFMAATGTNFTDPLTNYTDETGYFMHHTKVHEIPLISLTNLTTQEYSDASGELPAAAPDAIPRIAGITTF